MTDQVAGYGKAQWLAAGAILIIGAPVAMFIISRSESKPTVPYEAITICQEQLKSRANHPSTVSFSMLDQSTDFGAPGGGYRVYLGFEAKNSFGVELKNEGICYFAPGSLRVDNVIAREVRS